MAARWQENRRIARRDSMALIRALASVPPPGLPGDSDRPQPAPGAGR